jgi:hypothetical protein
LGDDFIGAALPVAKAGQLDRKQADQSMDSWLPKLSRATVRFAMMHSGLLLVFYDPKASNGALDWIDPALWSVETAVFPWKYLVENRISGALVSKFRVSETRGVVLKPS